MKNQGIKICFLADKHDLYDDRIYWKMAVPLVQKGFQVYYFLIGNTTQKGITQEGVHFKIFEVENFSKNKFVNFVLKVFKSKNYKKLFNAAKKIDADIYHFHDLWINKIGVKLKKLKSKPTVIYDVHEPYAEDFKSYYKGSYVKNNLMRLFSIWVDYWEKKQSKNYDLIIATGPSVLDDFNQVLGESKVDILYNFTDNYKLFEDIPIGDKKYDFIYSGGITELRGAMKILEATKIAVKTNTNIKVLFIGKYNGKALLCKMKAYVKNNKLENNVILHDFVNYSEISKFYNQSKIGLVTLFDIPTYRVSMPIKIFEYMAFGLPIIGSNFGIIASYIDNEDIGIKIDPQSPEEISNAMLNILGDKDTLDFYSKNGRQATLEKYRWDLELDKLVNHYLTLQNKRGKNAK